jgi:hypothetical protein
LITYNYPLENSVKFWLFSVDIGNKKIKDYSSAFYGPDYVKQSKISTIMPNLDIPGETIAIVFNSQGFTSLGQAYFFDAASSLIVT